MDDPPTTGGLLADDNAHAAAGARDHAHGRLDVRAVEVGHLLLSDLADVFLADGGDLVALRHAGSGLDAASLLDEQGGRRSLGDEVKLRSEYTVMTTGIIMPMSPLVRSLKSLVN